ncbi:hypothetical protein BDV29DRAFT_74567 [Aspergillus leporis]|uniref:Uncharacterized protein n=1 Tax=Aspergillus leporis TaxID=41062 RepID=A0A5N5WJZ1_9EURO|nr:hypothetical protein BDV29DRAFT_74567 [Aspergillus leporis]
MKYSQDKLILTLTNSIPYEDGTDLPGMSAVESKDRGARRRRNSARGWSWPGVRRDSARGTGHPGWPWGDRRSAGRSAGRRSRRLEHCLASRNFTSCNMATHQRIGKDSNPSKVLVLGQSWGKAKSSNSSQGSEGLHDGMGLDTGISKRAW